jgi:hypothetical protein
VLRTYWRRRREWPALVASPRFAHLQVLHLRKPAEAERWFRDVPGRSGP